MPAIPEANATDWPPSKRPTISSSASHVGVPSSRVYARSAPRTKFEASTGGTFNGEPGRRSRPAATSSESADESPARCRSLLLFMSEYFLGHLFETGWSGSMNRLTAEWRFGKSHENGESFVEKILAQPALLLRVPRRRFGHVLYRLGADADVERHRRRRIPETTSVAS